MHAVPVPPACRAAQLAGRFAEIPGSAGAGNVVYALRLRNRSGETCFVSGLPIVTLVGKSGRALPTHPVPAQPGAGTAVVVRLRPGERAEATARFSPDVPGPGEGGGPRCEPVAYGLRIRAPGGGSLLAPVLPPTPVCEHGGLQLSLYRDA
jgi:hypothetical protein